MSGPLANKERKQSGRLLIFLGSKLLCAIIKELLVHLHEELQGVVDEAVDGPGNTANTFNLCPVCKLIIILFIIFFQKSSKDHQT